MSPRTTKTIDDLANQLGFIPTNAAQASLPPELRDLHQQVLRAFVDTGTPPTVDSVRQLAGAHGVDADAALATLAAADLVHTAETTVRIAYPFAASPIQHRVRLAGGPALWACCAIDALGIPLMTDRDATIDSTDQHNGEPIRVTVTHGSWSWEPAGTVVLMAGATGTPGTPRAPGCSAADSVCPHVHFFTSTPNAEAYLAANPVVRGVVVDQSVALDAAESTFGPLLRA